MTLLKPFSITSFFAAKPSTIAKKRKPHLIEVDTDEGPDRAVIVADNAAIEKDSRLADVVFVIDGEGLLVSFHVVANHDDVTSDGLDFVSWGLQICPNAFRLQPEKYLTSLGLHSDEVTRTILSNVKPNDNRFESN